jgi:hypothetical protein
MLEGHRDGCMGTVIEITVEKQTRDIEKTLHAKY